MIYDTQIGLGQSLMQGPSIVGSPFPATEPFSVYAYPSNSQGICDANYKFTNTWSMNSNPAFSKKYYELSGRGSVWANVALGNTSMLAAADNGPGWWDYRSPGSLYDAAKVKIDTMLARRARASTLQRGRVIVHFAQGETDANNINGTTVTAALYEDAMDAHFSKLKADFGVDIFGVYQLGHIAWDEANTNWDAIRTAQANVVAARDDTYMFCTKAHELTPLVVDGNGDWLSGWSYLPDGIHYDRDTFQAMGRLAADALYALGGV